MNTRLHLSSLLVVAGKETRDLKEGQPKPQLTHRSFGREITNECGNKTFFGKETLTKRLKTKEDAQSPQNLQMTTYSKEIQEYLLERQKTKTSPECLNPDINSNMRATLFDWLIDVHLKFKLLDETLHKTCLIIDRYLSKVQVSPKKLQLIGTAALFISCKYEQIYPPSTRSFMELISHSFYTEQLIDTEGKILKTLDFDLTFTTPLSHLCRSKEILNLSDKQFHMSLYLLELSLLQPSFLKYRPNILAKSAIFLSRVILKKSNDKTEQEVKVCAKQMLMLVIGAPINTFQASRNKYAQKHLSEVSRVVIRPINQEESM